MLTKCTIYYRLTINHAKFQITAPCYFSYGSKSYANFETLAYERMGRVEQSLILAESIDRSSSFVIYVSCIDKFCITFLMR